MRDMGNYDAFPAELELEPGSEAQEGFEPCIARALPALADLPEDMRRPLSYETNMTVRATLGSSAR